MSGDGSISKSNKEGSPEILPGGSIQPFLENEIREVAQAPGGVHLKGFGSGQPTSVTIYEREYPDGTRECGTKLQFHVGPVLSDFPGKTSANPDIKSRNLTGWAWWLQRVPKAWLVVGIALIIMFFVWSYYSCNEVYLGPLGEIGFAQANCKESAKAQTRSEKSASVATVRSKDGRSVKHASN